MNEEPVEGLDRILIDAAGWIPASELNDMRALVRAGEPGVALENFCTQLQEHDVRVPAAVADELKHLAGAMGLRLAPFKVNP